MKIPKRGEIFQKILQIRIKFLFFTKNGVKITNFIQKLWQSRKNGKGDNGGDGGGDGEGAKNEDGFFSENSVNFFEKTNILMEP